MPTWKLTLYYIDGRVLVSMCYTASAASSYAMKLKEQGKIKNYHITNTTC